MSAALGAPTFVPSHKRSRKPVVQYKGQRWPNAVLEFSYKGANSRDPSVEYYRCIRCYKLSKQASGEKCPVAHLTLRNGVMATDPDHPVTPHSCNPNEDADAASVLSRRFMYEVSTDAYEVLFGALKASIISKYGHAGTLETSTTRLFDYESAAIQAVTNTSQTAMGPPKALNKKRDELGLRILCRDDVDVNEFFIRLRHLPFVPDDFRLQFAGDLLAARPHQPPLHAARLEQLVRYFTNFWLSNNIVKEIWGQFGNRGPRTTNMVEGWHNGLHSRLGSRHPDLAEFIQFLKVSQHAAQNRLQALLWDPLAVAKPTISAVVNRNLLLHAEMDTFASFISSQAPTYQDVVNYLDRIASFGVLPEAS
ncbi:hypothetical protein HPB47_004481 [Ixodes persulcatus]|uniref:Uncharacterized protein n=1 Tax=Ixodes persulcatus TaxID=34615 RepID=A0AC60PGG3_IXOPE|nr:hypothetical protein HPB47_004481 [Ixodes persulcatus]